MKLLPEDIATRYRRPGNPLLELFREHMEWRCDFGWWGWERKHERDLTGAFLARDVATKHMSWCVPDERAIALLEEVGPIVEVGAGSGYWAWVMRQHGIDTIPTDAQPYPLLNGYVNVSWAPVAKMSGPRAAARYTDRTLLMCWPDYDSPFALDTLRAYRGNRLVFVGEQYGCTGCNAFHGELLHGDEWDEVASVNIPSWYGMRDGLFVFER